MNPTNVAKFLKRKTPLCVFRKLALDSMTMIDDVDSTFKLSQHLDKNDKINHARKLEIFTGKGINLQQNSLSVEECYDLVDLIFNNKYARFSQN